MQALLFALLLAATPTTRQPIAITGATVIDVSASGKSANDIRDAVVVIRGGEIVAAGPRRKTKIPPGARIIRADGAYIVPGLNDVFAGLNSQAQANAYLYMGVTTILGSDEPGGRRGALLMNAVPGPRVRRMGFVSGLGGGTDGKPVELSSAGIMEQLEEEVRKGGQVLLLHYRLDPEETRMAVARARELGLATIGELGETTYTQGIELGIDAFVHTRRYSLELAPPELRAAVAREPFGPPRTTYYEYLASLDPDAPVVKEWAARLGASRVALIPTLAMSYLDLPEHENPWKEEIASILDPARRSSACGSRNRRLARRAGHSEGQFRQSPARRGAQRSCGRALPHRQRQQRLRHTSRHLAPSRAADPHHPRSHAAAGAGRRDEQRRRGLPLAARRSRSKGLRRRPADSRRRSDERHRQPEEDPHGHSRRRGRRPWGTAKTAELREGDADFTSAADRA